MAFTEGMALVLKAVTTAALGKHFWPLPNLAGQKFSTVVFHVSEWLGSHPLWSLVTGRVDTDKLLFMVLVTESRGAELQPRSSFTLIQVLAELPRLA